MAGLQCLPIKNINQCRQDLGLCGYLFTRALNLNLDKIFLPLLKILLCYEAFFGNLIFAIIARMLCGNHLNRVSLSLFCY